MPLPTDFDIAGQLLAHLQNASSDTAEGELRIPVEHYFDEEHAQRERDHLLGQPVVLGLSSQVDVAGAFFTSEVMGVPLLTVRQADGSVRTVRNVCRHRGARVEPEESGSKRVFACRYHGWTYDRDGALRNIPYGEFFPDVDPSCNGLVPVATEERHGLIWGVLGNDSHGDIDVAAHLGERFDAYMETLELPALSLYRAATYVLPLNWKLVVEGAMDPLHLRFLHPDTVGRLIETNTSVWVHDGDHGRLAMARRSMKKLGDDIPAGTDLRSYVAKSHFIYPNMMLNSQPASYELWTVFPDASSSEKCHVNIRVLAPAELTEEQRTSIEKTWDVLLDAAKTDDWPMEETIQASVRHTGSDSFIVGLSELPIQHFHRRLRANMGAPQG